MGVNCSLTGKQVILLKFRTDNDVKNHFYAVIRKCLRRISKIFGQKNSTEKIKNLKPSTLSNLL